MSLAMDCQSLGQKRANLSRDGSNLRSSDHGDPRSERSHPIANYPIDRASGFGANRVHSGHGSARPVVPRQARSRQDLGASGAACVDATKARPPASATINARISVSIGEPKRAMIGDGG
jgi:hypothetical protein